MSDLIDEAGLRRALGDRISQFGSARKYAAHLGISEAMVSILWHGHRPIGGRVLKDLGFTKVRAYKPAT